MLFFIGCHAGGIKNHPEKNNSWISIQVRENFYLPHEVMEKNSRNRKIHQVPQEYTTIWK